MKILKSYSGQQLAVRPEEVESIEESSGDGYDKTWVSFKSGNTITVDMPFHKVLEILEV